MKIAKMSTCVFMNTRQQNPQKNPKGRFLGSTVPVENQCYWWSRVRKIRTVAMRQKQIEERSGSKVEVNKVRPSMNADVARHRSITSSSTGP